MMQIKSMSAWINQEKEVAIGKNDIAETHAPSKPSDSPPKKHLR
jgi:hypothetical protein